MLKIEVTQKDIDEGIADECWLCPVALAAQRAGATFGYHDVTCGQERIYFRKNGAIDVSARRHLPLQAIRFINNFDSEVFGIAEPFSFEVEDLPRC